MISCGSGWGESGDTTPIASDRQAIVAYGVADCYLTFALPGQALRLVARPNVKRSTGSPWGAPPSSRPKSAYP